MAREELTEAVDELLEGWDRFVAETRLQTLGTGARSGRHRSLGQMAFVVGLVTHVHETARLLRASMPGPLTVVHMPLVRVMYECTLTAVWCDEVDDGAPGKMNEYLRSKKNTHGSAQKMKSLDPSRMPKPPENQEYESESNSQARRFEQLTGEVALDGAYFYYRAMSSLSHATVEVADEYLDLGEDGHLEFLARPKGPVNDWSYLTVTYCLIWSGMVANYYDKNRSRRDELRRIARRVGIEPELPVYYEAVERGRRRKKQGSSLIE